MMANAQLETSFVNLRQKFEAIFRRGSGVQLKGSNKPLKRSNDTPQVLGCSFPTFRTILGGKMPSEIVINNAVSNLRENTNLGGKVTLDLLSDRTTLETFCAVIDAREQICDEVRLVLDHPLAGFGGDGDRVVDHQQIRAEFNAMQGVYNFHRLGEDQTGNTVVVRGAIEVKSLITLDKKTPSICCTLTTPNFEGDSFSYFGLVDIRGGHRYYVFNQDELAQRDYIFITTLIPDAKNPRHQQGGFLTVRQSKEMEAIRGRIDLSPVAIDARDRSAVAQHMSQTPAFVPPGKFDNEGLLNWLKS